MAIAGAIVAGPQAAHAAVDNHHVRATTAAEQVHQANLDAFVSHDQSATRTYTVQPGDTLSSIAQRFYGNSGDWAFLYDQNKNVISDPNDIYVGEVLKVPSDPPANAASYTPKHAKATTVLTTSATQLSGTLDCSGLEALWEQAGGSSSEAFMAAEIAMAESGGNQYAVSPTSDYGYWQINLPSWGPTLATFNPLGNAKAAIQISDDGSNWEPWTTYQTGAYAGRC
jgi:LysM repeat protein